MKTNKLYLLWGGVIIAIAAPLLCAGYLNYQRNHFTCGAHAIIVDDDAILDIITDYSFDSGSGSYESSGKYIKGMQPALAASNNVSFNYWYENGQMIMVSNDTNELPKRAEPLLDHVPDFYHLRDRGISIDIVRANAESYYFVYGHTPVFYCTKSHQD
ncbi:hypothetical protein SAMN05216563_102263 [Phytobacter palmae]|nr:hypothetical protein SAMN05216563_102263 [Phytobacter palmae]